MQEIKEISGRYTWEESIDKLSEERLAVLEEAMDRALMAINSFASGEMDGKTFFSGLFMLMYECPEISLMVAEMIKTGELEIDTDTYQRIRGIVLSNAEEESEEIAEDKES